MTRLRPNLPPLPSRMITRPLDQRGYPIPWFVAYVNGEPEFRAMDGAKLKAALRDHKCWTCGQPLGRYATYVIGPMCAVNRVSSEPPSHKDCAEFAARGCPFLTLPKAQRREANLPPGRAPAGIMIERNPGVTLLWTTRAFKPFKVSNGVLFDIGDPCQVQWFACGRTATRAEVLESIDSGLPILRDMAEKQGAAAIAELDRLHAQALQLIPENADDHGGPS